MDYASTSHTTYDNDKLIPQFNLSTNDDILVDDDHCISVKDYCHTMFTQYNFYDILFAPHLTRNFISFSEFLIISIH